MHCNVKDCFCEHWEVRENVGDTNGMKKETEAECVKSKRNYKYFWLTVFGVHFISKIRNIEGEGAYDNK